MVTPYAQGRGWTLYHGDCLEILPTIEAGSVDAVVTDPPYSSGGNHRSDRTACVTKKYRGWSQDENGKSVAPAATYSAFSGDHRDQRSHLVWCSLWMSQAARVVGEAGLLATFTDWRQLPVMADAVQCGGFVWRGVVVWDKGIGRPMGGRFRNHLEYVVWGTVGGMEENEGEYPSALVRSAPPGPDDRVHLTEKPIEVVAHILRVCGRRVLDPFTGSGTTGVACLKTGREFVGCEIDEGYCEVAARRLRHAEEDTALFAEHATSGTSENGANLWA